MQEGGELGGQKEQVCPTSRNDSMQECKDQPLSLILAAGTIDCDVKYRTKRKMLAFLGEDVGLMLTLTSR